MDVSHVSSTSGSCDNSPAPSLAGGRPQPSSLVEGRAPLHRSPPLPRENNPCLDSLETMSIGSARVARSSQVPSRDAHRSKSHNTHLRYCYFNNIYHGTTGHKLIPFPTVYQKTI